MSSAGECGRLGCWIHWERPRHRHASLMAIEQTLVPDALDDEHERKSVVVKQAGTREPASVRGCHDR